MSSHADKVRELERAVVDAAVKWERSNDMKAWWEKNGAAHKARIRAAILGPPRPSGRGKKGAKP